MTDGSIYAGCPRESRPFRPLTLETIDTIAFTDYVGAPDFTNGPPSLANVTSGRSGGLVHDPNAAKGLATGSSKIAPGQNPVPLDEGPMAKVLGLSGAPGALSEMGVTPSNWSAHDTVTSPTASTPRG
jgi:hypothetical protein